MTERTRKKGKNNFMFLYKFAKFNRRKLNIFSIFLLFLAFSFIFSSCQKLNKESESQNFQIEKVEEIEKTSEQEKEIDLEKIKKQKQNEAIKNFVATLSDEQLIAQLFVLGIDGKDSIPSYVKTEFANASPGAFLLFSSNITNNAQDLCNFTSSVFNWFAEQNLIVPLFLIDNEGGDVYRLKEIASPLPSAKNIAQSFKIEKAQNYYALIAKQMRALGLHVNLAPLVEVQNNSNIAFLGSRTFGDAENVQNYAAAAVNGFKSEKIAAVLKHFPGNTNIDPHASLPHLSVDSQVFQNQYIAPFEYLMQFKPEMVLMSHIVVDCVEKTPACFSSIMINNILRDKLGFEGIVISDDLYMAALAENGFPIEIAVIQAVNAGVNLLMLSEKHFGKSFDVLIEEFKQNEEFASKIKASVERIIKLKIELGLLTFDENEMKISLGEKLNAEKMFNDFSLAKKEALDFLTK